MYTEQQLSVVLLYLCRCLLTWIYLHLYDARSRYKALLYSLSCCVSLGIRCNYVNVPQGKAKQQQQSVLTVVVLRCQGKSASNIQDKQIIFYSVERLKTHQLGSSIFTYTHAYANSGFKTYKYGGYKNTSINEYKLF